MGSPMGSMPNLPMLTESLLSEGAPSVPAKVPPQRIALLDNAKAALIYCVVLYHIAVVYTGADRPESPLPYASGFLMLLKPVVMPGFCLISGHVSRATLLPKHTRGLYQLVATYVLFQTLFYLNDMWSFRLNGFAFPTLPVQLFAPPRPAVTWLLSMAKRRRLLRRARLRLLRLLRARLAALGGAGGAVAPRPASPAHPSPLLGAWVLEQAGYKVSAESHRL